MVEDQGTKQSQALKTLNLVSEEKVLIKSAIPKNKLNPEILNELKGTEKAREKIDRNRMLYKGYRKTYNFTRDKMTCALGDDIKNDDIAMDKANDE